MLLFSIPVRMSVARIVKGAIKIPTRIDRSPTDILKALASTVKHIPNAPDTLLHDDPYLLPTKPNERGLFSLSKLSGISTAKFLLNKHPELFFRDDAEPKVESFGAPEEFNSEMTFTEKDIKWCIRNSDPINGLIAYSNLEEQNIKLSEETLLDFFELICYTNEDKIIDLLEVQKSFYARNSERQLVKCNWKNTGIASKIFNQIKQDLEPPRVYSAMIAGLSKFGEHATAKQVFEDFKEAHPDCGLFVEAYNGLISSIPNLCSSSESAYEAVAGYVDHMGRNLVKPNLLVINSILDCYRRFNVNETTVSRSFEIINDLKSLNVEPSLFTYTCLLNIVYRFRGGKGHANMMTEILDLILADEGVLSVRDERDATFLNNIMRLICTNLNSLQLANKLHKIYMKRPDLFGSSGQRQSYLDSYFKLMITTDSIENVMSFYNMYVPSTFRPNADTYEALAEALDLFQVDENIVKKIGRDVIDFRLAPKLKNDAIFRKDPAYVEGLEKSVINFTKV